MSWFYREILSLNFRSITLCERKLGLSTFEQFQSSVKEIKSTKLCRFPTKSKRCLLWKIQNQNGDGNPKLLM